MQKTLDRGIARAYIPTVETENMFKPEVILGRDGHYYILEFWSDGSWDISEVTGLRGIYHG